MVPVNYNIRNLRVRFATTLAAALGVGLVVFVLSAALMLSAGIERTLADSGSPDVAIVMRKGSDGELSSSIEDNLIGIISAAPGVKHDDQGRALVVGEVVVVVVMKIKGGNNGVSNVIVRGVPENVFDFRKNVTIVEGRPPKPGTAEVIVGRAIAGRFEGLDVGDTIELRKNHPATIVGKFDAGGSAFESEVWGDVFVVKDAFGRESGVSSVRVALENPAVFDGFEASIEQDQRLALEATSEVEFYNAQSQGTATFIRITGIVITVFFSIGAMIGATITMYGAVSARTKEVGVLRALGFSRTAILLSFLFESFVLALLGGIVGAAASLVLGTVEISMLNFTSFSEIVFRFRPTTETLVTALVCGAGMGIVGGFFPAVRAASVSPIEAMRG